MKTRRIIAPIALIATLAACQSTSDSRPASATKPLAPMGAATLLLADGTPAGKAQLFASGDQMSVEISLQGISPGVHAVHLHTTGSCEAPAFTSAGGHLNPGMRQHGMNNPQGAHLGDLPNATIAADGTGSISAVLRGTKDEVLADIYDADGTAIVVHAGPDDNVSDPAGNAGGRIACGVVKAH
ncbi:superoxide dismutase family protein [Altererythrobacter sp. CC-YST694]|uniref:superoxide dismutase family protein n=1 Tax=Altererythrobacter sp. CC-YST694 TaxID=2755038 RepID=UPI001D00CF42|nr:superoxide dismutase family protein [Altererythrobacter sp. CC-YST694]MCB5425237.1 superoxide dismutase family protein [Altererythrobacter sp. CC-YST694]